jgi:Xaa-Pro aminopeptidase
LTHIALSASEPRALEAPLDLARAQRILAREDLAALVATRPENVFYATGFAGVLYPSSGMSVSSAGVVRMGADRVTLLLSSGARFGLIEEEGQSDRRYFGRSPRPHDPGTPTDDPLSGRMRAAVVAPLEAPFDDAVDAVAGILQQDLSDDAQVAFDDPMFGAEVARRIGSRIRVRPGLMLFREIRAAKTAPEVDRLEDVLRRNEEAMWQVLGAIREGATWDSLILTFRREFATRGGRPLYEVCGIGSRALANFSHGGGPVRLDEPVFFDAGGTRSHYWTDTGRTMMVGRPSARLEYVMNVEAEGLAMVQEASRPGASAADVAGAFGRVAKRHGLPSGDWFWGHGIGLEIYELPRIRADSADVLVEGMVFNFESPFREIGLGGAHLEDTFVVEAGGCRRLSTLPRKVLIALDHRGDLDAL